MGKESLYLRLHCGVGLIGGRDCGSVLCGCVSALVFVNLEACHHLVNNGVGVVEAEFINSTFCLLKVKVSFTEVVFEVVPCFV